MASKKILVVDDEPGFSQLIAEYFKAMGYDVHCANNVEDAVNLFRKYSHRVVILDFDMPILTGDSFLPILQGMDPAVRAIVVSGCLEEEVEEKFRGLGYFHFFEKGALSLESLRQKVEEAFTH